MNEPPGETPARSPVGTPAETPAETPDETPGAALEARILDAAMDLVPERGWAGLGMAEIAEAAGVGLADLRRVLPDKRSLLAALNARIDMEVLAEPVEAGPGEGVRDRLFEVLMRRFDAIAPYKPALRRILRELPATPEALFGSAHAAIGSMKWMLEAAGVPAGGPRGSLRALGLAAVFAGTARIWLGDDSADLSATMQALDKRLRRAERAAGLGSRLGLL